MNLSNMPPEVRAFRRDLAKCEGVGCPIREQCGRFTRPAVDGQQWVQPRWFFYDPPDGVRVLSRCEDHQPLPVEPHGGAPEEGDGC